MGEATHSSAEYDEMHMRFLELLWGDGFLSPGGPEEVERIVRDVDFAGRDVLDLGCGSGGITLFLAERYRPRSITGFDVEEPAIASATARGAAKGLSTPVRFVRGNPGPLPFADASFDIVFSKDAMVHIADKDAIFREIFRVLRPGGLFAASDWLIGHDGAPSADMLAYLAAEGLSFGMASANRYEQAMARAGFTSIRSESRNGWYREEARAELDRLSHRLYDEAIAITSRAFVDKNIHTWRAMQKVLDSGEHCPTHLSAIRPWGTE